MGTIILVDIDFVLARENYPCLFATYNDSLKLAIPAEQLAHIRSLDAFNALPVVQAHIEKVGIARYQYQLAALKWHPHYVASCNVTDGAIGGVRYLSQRCADLRYCTARVINFSSEWNADLARCTKIWLDNNGFPHSDQILYCDGIKAKLVQIASMIREYAQPVLLIDDSVKHLLTAFDELPNKDQRILSTHLTLAAFGYDDCDQDYPLSVIPFPHWGEAHNLAVEKEFNYERTQSWRQR